VEISSNYPFYRGTGVENLENPASARPENPPAPLAEAAPEALAPDRVALVHAQNLASPPAAEVDLKQAAVLLRQVTHQFSLMNRQEMRELYQFQRLRDLCCRLQEQEGA
jgi:hypothetical protein